jgi:chromosomal replication initiation ATPase DnaA
MMMKPPIDSYNFTSTAALIQHYADVHRRIYDRPKTKKEDPKFRLMRRSPVWKGVHVENIINLVAAFYKMSLTDLMHGKMPAYVRVRYVTMFMSYYGAKKPMRHIAKNMDCHLNTVCDGIRKISDRRLHDVILNSEMNVLRAQIEALGKKGTPL